MPDEYEDLRIKIGKLEADNVRISSRYYQATHDVASIRKILDLPANANMPTIVGRVALLKSDHNELDELRSIRFSLAARVKSLESFRRIVATLIGADDEASDTGVLSALSRTLDRPIPEAETEALPQP